MKIFDQNVYRENLRNHIHFIEIMYEKQPQIIVEKLTKMIQDSLQPIAPIKRIQLTGKNISPLSKEAKDSLETRNLAQKISRENPTHENLRDYKHKRNLSNRIIAKERFLRKRNYFTE